MKSQGILFQTKSGHPEHKVYLGCCITGHVCDEVTVMFLETRVTEEQVLC